MNWINSVTQNERTTPKTSLSFYAIFAGVSFVGGGTIVAALGTASAPTWSVIGAAAITFFFVAVALLTVVSLNVRSPEKLMLGQVTARGYTEITESKATLGDSRSGTRALRPPPGAEPADDIVDAETVEEDPIQ